MTVTALDVDAAYDRIEPVVVRTPLQYSSRHAQRLGSEVWLKREDLQVVRSYKLRGAYNLLAQLGAEARAKGVVCASAGNHAQGVAYACQQLRLDARIYVPRTTPRQKRSRITALGGRQVELIVTGDTYDAASALARQDAADSGAALIPAFDAPDVVAGQGTVAREIVEQLGGAPDVLLVPVGGGGLIAGCVTWLAEHHPSTRIIGVEPSGAASMAAAVEAGEPVTLDEIDGFVDGAAVRRAGDVTAEIVRAHSIDLVDVDSGLVCEEMLDMFQTDGIIAEPAGALASAAMRTWGGPIEGSVVSIVSGGNHDVSRYAEVIERALVSQGVKHYWLVDFPQEPGALRGFLDDVLGPDDDITLFEYVKRHNRETGPALVGVELGDATDLPGLLKRFDASPVHAKKLSPEDPVFQYLL
ncbi:threonine ammonia-lyase IlvA [Nocardioidaceae bacterium SCSIO 66511]|nr:threonine ammonia-lyase IlvA [Nocardioidaceae bacterium SCSIO 66511]